MDSTLIYEKTSTGEEAMRQRTRVVQRNQRMVLILVDGKSSVGELSARTGNPQMTERALVELEQGGFIRPRDDLLGSLGQPARQAIRELGAAAIEQASHLSGFGDRVPRHSEVQSRAGQASRAPASSAPKRPLRVGGALSTPLLDTVSLFNEDPEIVRVPSRPPARPGPESTPGNGRAQAVGRDEVRIKPIQRGGSRANWPLRLGAGCAGLVLVLMLAVLLFPYDRYRPDVEARLSQLAGRPASVGAMRVSFAPQPLLQLDDVRFAGGGDETRIGSVQLSPTLASWFSESKVFSEMKISRARLPSAALGLLTVSLAAAPGQALRFEHVVVDQVEVDVRGLSLPAMDGEVRLRSDGGVDSLQLATADRHLQLAVQQAGEAFALSFEGQGWRPTADSPWLFDSLLVKGVLDAAGFRISEMDLRIFDGIVRGSASVGGEATPALVGRIDFEHVNARLFGQALALGEQFAGNIDGEFSFAARSQAWATLADALEGDGRLVVRHGTVAGIDLGEAARRVTNKPVVGGSTRFDSLSAGVRLTHEALRLNPLALSSGLMQSVGRVDIDRERRLSGVIDLQMRAGAKQLHVPLNIGGPLSSPELRFAAAGG